MDLVGLAFCGVLLNSFNCMLIGYRIQNKFKIMQHIHNLWFVDFQTHTHTQTPLLPAISLSIRLALTLTGFREIAGLSCGCWEE